MSISGPLARRPQSNRELVGAPGNTNLADLLERVLDKGVVIAGDIIISLGAVELLTLKVRLLIASIDKARELGINWWESDPALSPRARERELEGDGGLLKKRLDHLERLLLEPPREADQEQAEVGQWSNAAIAYVLDKQGRLIAELKQPGPQGWPAGQREEEEEQPQTQEHAPQPVQQLHEEDRPQAVERAPQPEAAQAEQPAGARPLLDPALHERIAQAMRPALEELPQRIARAWQSGEQARPEGRHEEEQPQEQEQPQAPQPEAAQTEQSAGAGQLLGPTLHERIAQAMRPVVEELRQRNAQARQPGEQARPKG